MILYLHFSDRRVAFSAYRSTSFEVSYTQKLPFPYTQLNIGNAYSTYYNYFKAPYDGFYWFSVSIYHDGRSQISIQAGSKLISCATYWTTASCSRVFQLRKYDTVYVTLSEWRDDEVDCTHRNLCQFSGFLIYST